MLSTSKITRHRIYQLIDAYVAASLAFHFYEGDDTQDLACDEMDAENDLARGIREFAAIGNFWAWSSFVDDREGREDEWWATPPGLVVAYHPPAPLEQLRPKL